MLVAGLVVSAVAVLLGIFTKLPQGGGGLANNLMVMSCFLSSPPPYLHPPPPPPNAVFFDIDAAIFDPRKAYVHQHASTCNITQGPMPQCHTKPRFASDPPINATFSTPTLSLPSLSPLLLMIGKAIANIAMIFVALSLPWLACTQLPLLAKIQKATDDSLATATVSGGQWAEIDLHHRLSYDLQTAMSEHSKALEEVERVTRQAREQSERATEREREMEQGLKRLEKERDDAVMERARGKKDLERLEKEKEEETERLKQEINRQIKASEVKERVWGEKRAKDKKRYEEDKESMKMGRERERENWKKQVEKLKIEKGEEQEELQLKIKKILKEKEEEKKGREREKEEDLRKQEKLEMEGEEGWKILEAQSLAKSEALEITKNLAQQRIAELEEENSKLRNAAMEKEKVEEELKGARAISEGERRLEKKRWEEQMAEAKELLSKMQEDLLSGRKLIEDLQTDKRIDRQLLLELRAQLARPTQHTPPTHPSPLRFNGTAYAVLAAPNVVPSPAPPNSSSRKVALPSGPPIIPPTTLPPIVSCGDSIRPEVASPIVRLPPTNPESRPIVRLPPPPPTRQENPSRLPMRRPAPVIAPMGPKGWRPNVPKPN